MCVCVYPEQFLIEYCLADRTVHRPRVLCSSTVVLSTARVATMAPSMPCPFCENGKLRGKAMVCSGGKGSGGFACQGWTQHKATQDAATSAATKGKAGKALAGKAKCKVGKAMKGMKAGKAEGKAGKAKVGKAMKSMKAGKAMKAGWKRVKACATQALDYGSELMKTSSMKETKHLYWCVSLELLEIRREALRQLML